jgi:hypothetical protein
VAQAYLQDERQAVNQDERLMELRGLLRARDALPQRIRMMPVDANLPVETRLLAIARWTAAWDVKGGLRC